MKLIRLASRVLIAVMLLAAATVSASADSYAPIAAGDSIKITSGDVIIYGSHYEGTYKKTVKTPSDGKTRNAYCVQPWLANPGTSTRSVSEVWTASSSGVFKQTMRNLCYYSQSYGGADWTRSNWFVNRANTTTYDMAWVSTYDEEIAVVHLALSMAWWQEKQGTALSKIPSYSTGTVKGNTYSKYWNAAYAVFRAAEAAAKGNSSYSLASGVSIKAPSNAPENFACCLIKVSNKQNLVFGTYGVRSTGTLKLTKSSADKTVTAGNSAYNFDGISYKVYADSACTKAASSTLLKCNKTSGATNTLELDVGTYYVKEYKTNSCYKLDNTVHKVVIKRSQATSLGINNGISDSPARVDFSFYKAIDGDSSDVTGFKFTLKPDWSSSATEYTAVSDENGKVDFGSIPMGSYTLSEDASSFNDRDGDYSSVTGSVTVNITKSMDSLPSGISSDGKYHNKYTEPEKPSIKVQKVVTDENGNKLNVDLSGFSFSCNGETVKTDSSGLAVFKDMNPGTYTVTENLTADQEKLFTAANGGSQNVALVDKAVIVTQKNVINTTELKVKKTSTDGCIQGVSFTLSGTDCFGREISEQHLSTDDKGELSFGRVLPGDYVIEETSCDGDKYIFADSYRVSDHNNPAKQITVDENGAKIGGEYVTEISFKNTNYSISLHKVEALEDGTLTDNPVAGAEYGLYRVEEGTEDDGSETATEIEACEPQVTDENGDVCFFVEKGKYRLRETGIPNGYIGDENNEKYVDITVSDENPTVVVTDSSLAVNQRDYGSITIDKEDKTTDERLPDAEFTLYLDEACTEIAGTAVTNDNGQAVFNKLEWGTYYIKETKAPQGFELNDEIQMIKIGRYTDSSGEIKSCLDAELIVQDEPKLGSVVLVKVDEATGETRIEGASYNLYTGDGKLVEENLVTDDDGEIAVDNLSWGAYYFEEEKAPSGYGLSESSPKFTVNAKSASVVQEITDEEPVQTNDVIATKRLLTDDIWYDHGVPSFVFTLKGEDIGGVSHTYNQMVTFSEDYVENHTDSNGYVEASVTFTDVPAGTYTLSESDASRYTFGSISNVSSNGTIKVKTVEFDMSGSSENQTSYATFYNIKNDWNQFSDKTAVTNVVRKFRTYTALYAEYNGSNTLEANMPFTDEVKDEILNVYAIYDDGTEKKIDTDDYEVYSEDGSLLTRIPKVSGTYTATVNHTEKDTERADTFTYKVPLLVKYAVKFETNGGSAVSDIEVNKYESIADTVDSDYYKTTRSGYSFEGWYSDAELTKPYDMSAQIEGRLTLYAKWKELNATITYDDNGGSGGPGSSEATYLDVAVTSLTEPVREGYEFLGWSTTKSATVTDKWYDPGDVIKEANTLPSAMTLYAQWYDVDTLEKSINSCTRSGDFVNLSSYSSADTTEISAWATRSVQFSTSRTSYKSLGIAGWDSTLGSDMCIHRITADQIDGRHNGYSGDSLFKEPLDYFPSQLYVQTRTGSTTSGTVDARIGRMLNTSDACLTVDDLLVKKVTKDNISLSTLTYWTYNSYMSPALDGYAYVGNMGYYIANASSSGKNFSYVQLPSCNYMHMAFSASADKSAKILAARYDFFVKSKSVGTAEYSPDIVTYGSKGAARLHALQELEAKRKSFFTSSNCVVNTVNYTGITTSNTHTSNKTLTLDAGDRIVGCVGFDYNNGSGSGVTYATNKGMYLGTLNSNSSVIYQKTAGTCRTTSSKWYNTSKIELNLYVFCIDK